MIHRHGNWKQRVRLITAEVVNSRVDEDRDLLWRRRVGAGPGRDAVQEVSAPRVLSCCSACDKQSAHTTAFCTSGGTERMY